jgi:hypothetical protein
VKTPTAPSREILYRGGYKYQLALPYAVRTAIVPLRPIVTDFVCLDMNGLLTLAAGYAWDGPSGPTIDTKNFMRGSLVHDALYQLMRDRHLDHDAYRDRADFALYVICREDGMWWLRAGWVYLGVRLFGEPSADPAHAKRPTAAP